jgi:hypothetical protein
MTRIFGPQPLFEVTIMKIFIKVSKAELEEAELTEDQLKYNVLRALEESPKDLPGYDVELELED